MRLPGGQFGRARAAFGSERGTRTSRASPSRATATPWSPGPARTSDGTLRVHAAFRPAGNGFVPDGACRRTAPTRSTPRSRPAAARSWSGLAATAPTATAEASVKPENASFLPPQTLSAAGEDANAPQVAVGKDGTAVATWYAATGDHVAAAIGRTSPAGLRAAGDAVSAGHGRFRAAGRRRRARRRARGVDRRRTAAFIQAAFRPRGAGFGLPQDIAEPTTSTSRRSRSTRAGTPSRRGPGS